MCVLLQPLCLLRGHSRGRVMLVVVHGVEREREKEKNERKDDDDQNNRPRCVSVRAMENTLLACLPFSFLIDTTMIMT